jgi:hypothetical protein
MVSHHPNKALGRLIDQWKDGNPGKEVVYTIADNKHDPTSDHQMDSDGTIDAGDFMPGDNVSQGELDEFAEVLRRNKDKRIKYVIRRQRIFYGAQGPTPYEWRKHTGEYHGHTHVSTRQDYENDGSAWKLNFDQPKWKVNVKLSDLGLPTLNFGDDDNKMAGYEYVHRAQLMLNFVLNTELKVDGVYQEKTRAAVERLASTGNGRKIAIAEWTQLYGLSKAAV